MQKITVIATIGFAVLLSANVNAEPTLHEALDSIYGPGQSFTEISADQVWRDLNGGVEAEGKWAGHSHSFGITYYTADGYQSTMWFDNASGDGIDTQWDPGAYSNDFDSFDLDNAKTWSWVLYDQNTQLSYYSDNSLNTDGFNHMRTFALDDVTDDHGHQVYVICWEDLYGGGDMDWQDNISEIRGATPVVPAPGAVLLGGIGAVAVGWLRQRRKL